MIYEFDDYRKLLKNVVNDRKERFGKAYSFQAMAKACKVEKTYLARVLNTEKSNLNDDQLFRACKYLSFNEAETDYVQLLQQLARSSDREKRGRLERKILAIREQQARSDSRLDVERLVESSEDSSAYYLDPYMQVVHMLLFIERYRKDLRLIAKDLRIDDNYLTKILTALEGLQIISYEKGIYHVKKNNLHLSGESPIYRAYRYLLRLKGMERTNQLDDKSSFHFSVIFTADEPTRKKIHQRLLEFLSWAQQEVSVAPQEGVYQLSLDLFPWSNSGSS